MSFLVSNDETASEGNYQRVSCRWIVDYGTQNAHVDSAGHISKISGKDG